MGFVNVTIFEKPEEVSWRIIDALSQEQFYGYPVGNYEEASTSTKFVNMQTGIWEFQLTRATVAADVRAKIGNLNRSTGEIDPLGELAFDPNSRATTVSTLIRLI